MGEFMWNGKPVDTICDLIDALCACATADEAAAFAEGYRLWLGPEIADANIGYVLGYLDKPSRDRLHALFAVDHPFFGSNY